MSSVDFNALLNAPSGTAVKPLTTPVGDYPGIIQGREYFTPANKTPYVELKVGFTDWPESVPPESRGQTDKDGNFHSIDITKRSVKTKMYLSEDAIFMLEALFDSCNIDQSGKSRRQCIEELVGKYVIASVTHYTNEKNDPPTQHAECRRLTGAK